MTTIVTYLANGGPLTPAQMDTNLTNLNNDKLEKSSNLSDLTSVATARTNLGLAIGTNVQAYSADLAVVAGLTGVGMATKTAAGTWALRTLAFAAGLTITNPDGVAGAPTFGPANDLAAVEALSSTGFAVRSASETWVQRTIVGTTGRLSVTNGDGISGNPTLDIDSAYVGQSTITTVGTVATGTWASTITTADSNLTLTNSTRNAKFSAAAITLGQTRTYTLPDVSDTLVTLTAAQTLTNKTLTGPVFTGQALFSSGAVGSPSISFVGTTDLGLYISGSRVVSLAANGAERIRFMASGGVASVTALSDATLISSLNVLSDGVGYSLQTNSTHGNLNIVTSASAMLWSISNTGHLVPGTDGGMNFGSEAQKLQNLYGRGTLSMFGVYTDSSNKSSLNITGYSILLAEVGTVASFDFAIGTSSTKHLVFRTDGDDRWFVDRQNSGRFLASTDNVSDFGAAGANRARSLYWGTQALAPDGTAANPSYAFASDANTGIRWISADTFALVTGGADRIHINGNGHMLFATDNVADIGAAAATRPRRIYAGTDFVGPIGATTPASAAFTTITASGLVSANGNSVNATPGYTSVNAENGFYFTLQQCGTTGFGVPNWASCTLLEAVGGDVVIDAFSVGKATIFQQARSKVLEINTNGIDLAAGKTIKIDNVQILKGRITGWATATGSATRTTFDTTTVTTAQLAERVKALIDDLHGTAGHGLIGT